MKLRTSLTASRDGSIVDATDENMIHDAACAHALKQAEREADALFNASTRWFRARAWINTRADELMHSWCFDSGEVE